MIRYALACERSHEFEGWFSTSADFDDQQYRGLLSCPVCATKAVTKQIMAPSIAGTKRTVSDLSPKAHSMMMETLTKVRQHVEDNFDYVGDSFAAEARAIHEGTSEPRGSYGEASPVEVKALVADGVPVAPLPPPPPKKTDVN